MTTPLTFSEALAMAEATARKHLAPALHTRLGGAVQLVRDGRTFQASDGTWSVESDSRLGTKYTVNGSCDCDDLKYNRPLQDLCKHRLAMFVHRKVVALMAVSADVGPVPADPQAPEIVATSDNNVAPLPEAPASATVRLTIAGHPDVLFTLRDTDEGRLLQRLQAVLAQYPQPQTPAQVSSQGESPGKDWCAIHNVQMKENHKDGRTWFSHRTDDDFCKGRKAR